MCRWFAYLGLEPQLLEDILMRPRHSLIKQVDHHFLPAQHMAFDPQTGKAHRLAKPIDAPARANDTGSVNYLTNMDGFGVGWWTGALCEFEYDDQQLQQNAEDDGQRPVVYRTVRPPLNDLVLRSLARGTSARAVVAHVRAAPGLTPVVETNCHPYRFGRYLFAHNGVIGGFVRIRTALLARLPFRYQEAVLGTTDSEHLGAIFMFYLCGLDGNWDATHAATVMADAMATTVHLVADLQAAAAVSNPTSLNLVACSGRDLVATRFSSHGEPPSLYYSCTAGAALNRKFEGHPDDQDGSVGGEGGKGAKEHLSHVIVASEPTTLRADDWELLPPQTMILVDDAARLTVRPLK